MMAARWSKEPNEKGLAGVCQGPRGFLLKENGETLAHVAPVAGKDKWDIVGWYWYGFGENSYHHPVATEDEAKAQATVFYRKRKPTRRKA